MGTPLDPLVVQLAEEMSRNWQQGNCLRVEEFLDRHPDLWQRPEAAVRLVYEEICLRQERGEEHASVEVVSRFPQWQAQLEALLSHPVTVPKTSEPFPTVGESFGDFRLIAELGRGRWGRVFLATQPALADRPVVLKLTPRGGLEHQSLARLQHTHIVPIYSIQEYPDYRMQTLCMPYFGGATLGQLLYALRGRSLEQCSGKDLLRALDQAQKPVPLALPVEGPQRQVLSRASYTQAVCWIGSCVANALDYAHERGLIHLDVKPSNVLVAADGQPMLLDFHLARAPLEVNQEAPTWLGGTPVYMSPEQKAALLAVRSRKPLDRPVDGRSDVYSLGSVLYEALGGTLPLPADRPAPPLAPRNPQVTPGLDDLIHKCLAPDPRDRYPSAAALWADLRNHLEDKPLKGVPNRLGERWTKWRRRKPHALRFAVLFLLLLAMGMAGAGYILYQFSQRRDQGRTILAQAQVLLQQQQYQEGLRTVDQGLNLLQGVPASADLRHQLEEVRGQLAQQAEAGQRRQAAEQLHQVADQIRLLYGFGWQSPQTMAYLEKECRTLWDRRALIRERLGPGLGPEAEKRIDTDFLDLAILWADLRVQLATQTRDRSQLEAALRAGLQVLDQAEALFGPSTVLCRQREVYAQDLGLKDLARTAEAQARALPPHNAWEHYTLGEFYLRSNNFAVADQEFRQALRLEPQDLWAEFFHGICTYRLGQYEEAATTFRICCALAPQVADYSFDLAQAQAKIPGQTEEALANYTKALELNPDLVPALLNRGILFYQLHQDDQAIADMLLALQKGADPEAVAHNLSLIYQDPLGGIAEKWLLSWLMPEVAHTARPRASDH